MFIFSQWILNSLGGDMDSRQLIFLLGKKPMWSLHHRTLVFLRIFGSSSLTLMASNFYWLSEWKMLRSKLL